MRRLLKIAIILIIIFSSICILQKIFKNPERFSEEAIKGYYNEKTEIDALFIGSSRVYMFWVPVLAYNEYGISSYNLTVSGQTAIGDRYIMEEALKTQDPTVIVIEMSSLVSDVNEARTHRMADNMKFSTTKMEYIDAVSTKMGITGLDKLEYYVPFVRFHSRWNELSKYDFSVGPSRFRGSYWDESRFLKTSSDFEYRYVPKNNVEKIDEDTENDVIQLLRYIKKNNLNVFFFASPTNDVDREKVNYVKKLLERNNMEYLDLNYLMDEIRLDIPNDYCDVGHTNVSGAIKVTSYLGRILQKKFSLMDHRNEEKYIDWENSYKEYYNLISPFLSEEEKARLHGMREG